jgi:light-regulated signal transduction histidine kinase (bacteriophytochrome)
MDVKMPNLNGFETAQLIYEREKLRHIPIVFITANSLGEEHMFKGYSTGAVDYIYKPVNPELLRAKVGVYIDLYTKNHQLMAQEKKLIAINKNLENEIRERKMSEEQVNELNRKLVENIDRLEAANKDLDRFAFMSSHDLQEPLRKIRTFTDLLYTKYKDVFNDDAVHYINRIQKAAQRMQTLIKDILEFSQLSNDTERFVETDLNILVEEVLSDMETLIHEKQAKINIKSLPSLEVNPGLIRPLFFNLIGNALKYSRKETEPVIEIYGEPETGNDDLNAVVKKKRFCRIFVKDNGIGFDQKYAEQIFEMFVRLHGNSEYQGTGIGLALCKQIVEKHQGYISALSSEKQGSTFIISLPM